MINAYFYNLLTCIASLLTAAEEVIMMDEEEKDKEIVRLTAELAG